MCRGKNAVSGCAFFGGTKTDVGPTASLSVETWFLIVCLGRTASSPRSTFGAISAQDHRKLNGDFKKCHDLLQNATFLIHIRLPTIQALYYRYRGFQN